MLAVGVVAVVLAVFVALAGAAGYVVSAHHARGSADLAALAGAGAFVSDGRSAVACSAAARVARVNGSKLLDCQVAGDRTDFVLSVRVTAPVARRLPGLPAEVTAMSHAGPTR